MLCCVMKINTLPHRQQTPTAACVWARVCVCRCLCLNLNFVRPYFMRLPMRTFKILYSIFLIFFFEFFPLFLPCSSFISFVVHNFRAVEVLNFVFFLTFGSSWSRHNSHSQQHTSPPPLRLQLLCMTSFLMAFVLKRDFRFAERVLWLVFMAIFKYTHTHTHTARETDIHISYFVIFGYHLFKVWFALWQLLSYFRAAARGVCVICDLLTSKMQYVSTRDCDCVCVCFCKRVCFVNFYSTNWHCLENYQIGANE